MIRPIIDSIRCSHFHDSEKFLWATIHIMDSGNWLSNWGYVVVCYMCRSHRLDVSCFHLFRSWSDVIHTITHLVTYSVFECTFHRAKHFHWSAKVVQLFFSVVMFPKCHPVGEGQVLQSFGRQGLLIRVK